MRIFINLTLAFLAVVIHTSWAGDIKTTENLLRDMLQNNNQGWKFPTAAGVSHLNPSSWKSRSSKQVDERISDIIAENVLHFGHNLGLELAALDPYAERSEIFSPLSIMAALSMLTLGAKGRSYQELKQLLGLDSDSELIENPSKYHEEFGLMLNDLQHINVNAGGLNKRSNANWRFTTLKTAPIRSTSRTKTPVEHIINVANGLFVQSGYTLNPDYRQVLKSIYETELQQLDFQAKNRESRDHINAWVDKATFGKIPKVIDGDIDKSTNIILASVLYFKAFWETSFFPRSTIEDNFYPDGANNPPIKVQMMPTGGIFPFYNAKEYDCRIIGLPYKGNETTMYVIQPNNSSRQKLRELQNILNAHKINAMIDNMERKTTVMVFPKMHFTRSMNMKEILKKMDVRDIFINGYSDLSLIGGKSSYVTPNFVPAPASTYAPVPATAQVPVQAPSNAFAPIRSTVSFESIDRKMPFYPKGHILDRYAEPALVFSSRFGETKESGNNTMLSTHNKTMDSMQMSSTTEKPSTTVGTKSANNKRGKRQVSTNNVDPVVEALHNIEANRLITDTYPSSDLFVDDIIHKVVFSVDEQGTEAAAATLTYLHRSGTDVVFRGDTPFLILIRHDPTKLPLFYGIINKPEL
ncbi:serine protease inhibitor 28Dc [Lucilia sericata]|uniref:serine protease inhibitor 28Dc n=1 Tax=Lucilia sericata TaxID=13632 RepID=UPI0018A813E3|nr:serine protease inhibitor 28Dc [Lucilia sericata]